MNRDHGNAFDIKGFATAFGETFDVRGFAEAFRSAFGLNDAGKSFAEGFRQGAGLLRRQLHRIGKRTTSRSSPKLSRISGRH